MKRTLFLITLIGFLLSPGFLLAQKEAVSDTIVLKSGGIIVGKIWKYNIRKGVIMQHTDGHLMEIAADHIARVTLQSGGSKVSKPENKDISVRIGGKPYAFREKGFYYTLSGGALFGQTPQNGQELGVGLHATSGYLFHHLLGAGIGLGFDNYSVTGYDGRQVMTVSAETRGYLTKGNRAPYYTLQAGYGFAFKDEEVGVLEANGGIMLHPALGLRLGAREDVNFSFDIGYRFQRVTQVREFNPWSNERQEERIWYKRFALQLGLIF
ncbi:MAG: hypothetical protein SFU99_05510 [Saprospiraceae bacterium]|nr:hypothetical protein [Saprospiraceae bacterium]